MTVNYSFANSNPSEALFYIFGKGNFVNSAGSESDYKNGENDFSIMSAHQTLGFGLGLIYSQKTFFIGLEAHYNLNGKATLTDPSDNDTVEIDTYKYIAGYFTLGVNLMRNNLLTLYINGGGGFVHPLDAETKIYISKYDIESKIEPPEKKYHLSGFTGVGAVLSFTKHIGLFVNGRYLYIAVKEQPQTIIEAIGGIAFRF